MAFFRLKTLLIFFFSIALNIKLKYYMKTILIKEIDVLRSKMHRGKKITEYLVYLIENDIKLACYSEIGVDAKNLRVNELISEFYPTHKSPEDIIKEISFEQLINN